MPFARFVEVSGKNVVFYEIELSVFRDDDVEPSVVVDDDRTKRFNRRFESFWDFLGRKASYFATFPRYVDDMSGQAFPFIHFDDVHPMFRFSPKHPYFVIRRVELFECRIVFLSSFLELGYRDEKVVGILGIPNVEREHSFASGISVDFQYDVASDPVFAFEKIAEQFRI